MKKLTLKTGALAAAKAQIKALKADHKLLTDNLTESLHRIDGLRQANAHASSKVSSLQAEVAACNEIIKLAGDAHSKTYDALTAEQQRANDLYIANQKFAEDDHEYRLSAVKAQNQLTNDNLHQGDEIERLRVICSSQCEEIQRLGTGVSAAMIVRWAEVQCEDAKRFNEEIARLNECLKVGQGQLDRLNEIANKGDLKIANLQQTLDRERSSHTMTFLAKGERIDELLIIEKNLSDDKAKLTALLQDENSVKNILYAEIADIRKEARVIADLHAAHIAICTPARRSLLSRVWQWLNSPY